MKIRVKNLSVALALLAISILNSMPRRNRVKAGQRLAKGACLIAFSLLSLSTVFAQGTAFTYQGRLNNNGASAGGSYDLTFTLFATNTSGVALAGPVTNAATAVTNGLFTVTLDFGGGLFTGSTNRWLEIGVRTNGVGSFTTLAPRQQITPAPYAIFANTASNLSGTILNSSLPVSPNFSGTVVATSFQSGGSGSFLAGAANSVSGSYNAIGGGEFNTNSAGYATIGGGFNNKSTTAQYITIGGGRFNVASANDATIGGGVGNSNSAAASTIGGGYNNIASQANATIGGGQFNNASGQNATVGGGQYNTAGPGNSATVPGGANNLASGTYSFAAGYQAQAIHQGAFVWADSELTAFSSTVADQFLIRAQGGVGINTNNPNGAALSINGTAVATSFSGKGAVPWQLISGPAVSAVPNTGYLVTNNTTQVVVTLPASPNIGDVVRIASPIGWKINQNAGQTILVENLGLGGWTAEFFTNINGRIYNTAGLSGVAISSDATKMVAINATATLVQNGIYTSTDSGATWTLSAGAPYTNWQAVASSADGTKLVAAVLGGQIYTSANSGSTWTPSTSAPATDWYSVASSSDGTKLVAVGSGGIYTSINSGSSWAQPTAGLPPANSYFWLGGGSVASSADGTKLMAAGATNGLIYISINSGNNWSAVNASGCAVASSADGTKLVAVDSLTAQIFTSADSGGTWTTNTFYYGYHWSHVASSADGSKMVALGGTGICFKSFDSGAGWSDFGNLNDITTYNDGLRAITSSADGNTLVGVGRYVYIYNLNKTVGTSGSIVGTPYSAIELLYMGNGQFMPISYVGPISLQ